MYIVKPEIIQIYDSLTHVEKGWSPPGVSLIAARRMWPFTRGENSIVAVVDTGIDYNHPDLKNNVIGGISFVSSETDYMDLNGHGTHVAGIIAANGTILGVAPEAKLLGVKVLNKDGFGSYTDILGGLSWARNWRGSNGEKVNVINLSLGGPFPNPVMHQEIIKAVNEGITIVCAAGNSGDADPNTREISYPAYYEESMAVGAVNLQTGIADFSNSNERIDIVAPGVDTYSTYPGNKYVKLSGTSMAAPHVSGAIALIYSRILQRFGQYPSVEDIKKLISYQAIDLGKAGFDNLYGYGLFSFNIDGGKAISIIVGERKYVINNKQYVMQNSFKLIDDIVYAPAQELCDMLGTDSTYRAAEESGQIKNIIDIWS